MEQMSILFLLVARTLLASAICPHEEPLAKLSDIAGTFDKSSVVTISEGTLLDVELLDVTQVIVEGTGSLVFNRGQSITIKTRGIIVRGDGKLVIGSQDCPHQDQVNIYLEGTRTVDRDSLGPEGDKGIMVTDNGVLQIFGQDKLAWTKLTSTVERFDLDSSNIKFRHLDSDMADYQKYVTGLAISIFNSSLERRFYAIHNYKQGSVFGANKVIGRTVDALQTLEDGDVVTVSLRGMLSFLKDSDTDKLFEALEQAAGMPPNELTLRNLRIGVNIFDAWALVFVYNGNSYQQSYQQQIGTKLTRTVASVEYKGYKVSAVSVVRYKQKDKSSVDTIILKPSVGYPKITVLDDISSWNVGDEVLLTSTDYSWKHAEVRRIKEKTDDASLILDGELYYRHFGQIENKVDMRGEVALLTRNIKIQGVMSLDCPPENGDFCDDMVFDSYGGHLKVHESFGSVQIEGVELQFMGQTSDKGFYPIHFHMCRNITGKTAIIRRNSIHNTFRRAITVHGTFGSSETALGVQVIENVAYDVLGHAFFLEDGAEMATLFQGNLGASIKNVVNDFATDRSRPAVFWITNPKVIMVGNVASGSVSMGIWYTFPREPVGLSEGLVYAWKEAKHTKLWRFDRNVVHSNGENGMFFDNILDNEDGKVVGCMEYEPREDPLDENSPWAKSQIVRLTAYKNMKVNTWLRGGYFEVIQYSSAESKRGIHIARGSEQPMFVKKSVIVGQSLGNHEDEGYPDALNGESLGQYLGAVIHDGPTYYDSCWFQGFKPNANNSYKAGAIGFSIKNKFTSSVVSNMTDIRFGFTDSVDGNRMFDGDVDTSVEGIGNFEEETATLRDGDGSITNCPSDDGFQWSYPTQLVVPEKFALTEKCEFRKNWHLAACNDKYGKIKIMVKVVWKGNHMHFDKAGQMKRHDLTAPADTAVEDGSAKKMTEYTVILGSQKYYYSLQFIKAIPKRFRLDSRGIERYELRQSAESVLENLRNNLLPFSLAPSTTRMIEAESQTKGGAGVTVGMCLPENARYGEDYIVYGVDGNDRYTKVKFVDTIEKVMSDTTMSRIYLDGRFVYTRLHSNRPRDPNWDRHDTDHCSGRICPRFIVEMKKELPYTPCFTPTKDETSATEILSKISKHECTLPPSAPGSDWGAGDSQDPNRDGQWGEWSSWKDCCFPEGETVETTRYRVCDNPPRSGNGTDCVGPSQETEQCQTPCPVNGVMSEWSDYSDCFCDGIAEGTYGMQTKRRVCVGVAHGGEGCDGNILDSRDCVGDCGYFPDNSKLPPSA